MSPDYSPAAPLIEAPRHHLRWLLPPPPRLLLLLIPMILVLHLPLVLLLLRGVAPLLGLLPPLLLMLLLLMALVGLPGLQPPLLLLLLQCRRPSLRRNLPALLQLLLLALQLLLRCHADHRQGPFPAPGCAVWQAGHLCGSICSGTR